MKIVIDIPEEEYKLACKYPESTYILPAEIIKKGTPLPKGHGRLIDEDNVIEAVNKRLKVLRTHEEFNKKHGDIDLFGVMPYIAEIPTIIEADKGDTE